MKNRISKIIFILAAILISLNSYADEVFNFDVTEIQILDNGNKFIGLKRGTAKSNDGVIIDADRFEYNKSLNVLEANGSVKINDTLNNFIIFTDRIIYYKNKELINTFNNSKGLSLNDNIAITAKNFEYKKSSNTITAEHNVVINDKINDKQQKINILYQFIEDKKNKKEENIKILEQEKKNNITELKTELSFFQPNYEKILKIQKEIKEQDENIFRLKYSYNNLSEPIYYSNKDTEFGDCVNSITVRW